MQNYSPKETITIIGAGLVGALMSIFLAQQNFKVKIFERRSDIRATKKASGRSINLALANRGITALKAADIFQQLEQYLIPMRGRMRHDKNGEQMLQPYGIREHEVIYSVERANLNKKLISAAEKLGVEFYFNHSCESLNLANNEITFAIEDNKSIKYNFDILIGADGYHSQVRNAIFKQMPQKKCSEQELEHGYKELTIPAVNGKHQMEANSLHIWPRNEYMLIALPNLDGSFTVTLFLPHQGNISFATLNNKEKVEAFFKNDFPDAYKLIPNLGNAFLSNPVGKLSTIYSDCWSYNGNTVLIGDAAHAIVPFHGQGMNAGFEDCLALAQKIEEGYPKWETIFNNFYQQRKPNADAIATMALENYLEMRKHINDQHFLNKKKLSQRLENEFPQQFIPRYSLVMFHTLDYALAQQIGAIEEEILEELLAKNNIDAVSLTQAESLIKQKLSHMWQQVKELQ